MKKYTLVITTILMAQLSVLAQKPTTTSEKEATAKDTDATIKLDTPEIEKVVIGVSKFKFTETVHDFGTVKQNHPASYTFEFTNTGSESILIETVQASCNCTTPSWTKEPIEVGKSGTITAIYNSLSSGTFSKTVTVKFSNGEIQLLTIQGFVEAASEIPATPVLLEK